MAAYYNEWEPYAAQWLRNLIAAGHIAPGDVDERDIREIKADDLRGYEQCHFFAGIGGWSLALRMAGWEDARPVWTGSCPCQPFSSAGKNKGQSDERHIWPDWFGLIAECHPPIVFGEQVERALTHGWADEVKHDLESSGYAFAAAVLPACAVQAPHERNRFWFVAHAQSGDDRGAAREFCEAYGGQVRHLLSEPGSSSEASEVLAAQPSIMANTGGRRCSRPKERKVEQPRRAETERSGKAMAYPASEGQPDVQGGGANEERSGQRTAGSPGWWDIEPTVGRVADGIPCRVGKLRALGNAIVPQVAAEFIKATM
jgi:DNA (cytosine-5)-methyltransferase 1